MTGWLFRLAALVVPRSSRLFPFVAPYAWTFPVVAALGLTATLLEGAGISLLIPAVASLSGNTVGNPAGFLGQLMSLVQVIPQDLRLLLLLAIVLLCIGLKCIVQIVALQLSALYQGRFVHDVRVGLAAKMLLGDYRLIAKEDGARSINTFATESWRVGDVLQLAHQIVTDSVAVAILCAYLLVIDPLLFLVAAGGGVVVRLVQATLTRTVAQISEELRAANERLAKRMVAVCLLVPKLARVFGTQQLEQERFASVSDAVRERMYQSARITSVVGPALEVLYAALFVGVVFVAYVQGTAVPVLIGFLAILYRLQPFVRNIGRQTAELHARVASIKDVERLLAMPPEPVTGGPIGMELPITSLEFQDVSFQYEGARGSLTGLSFQIPVGTSTAITGRSGAGKSTVVNLLLGLLKPDSGDILVNGKPLSTIPESQWRRVVAVAGQDLPLVDGTVRENLLYGAGTVDERDVVDAARRAHAHAFIQTLPQGYDTVLVDGGTNLSGGQRQRLEIARALIRGAEILVLDEAMSGVDAESEREILRAIGRLDHRTVIIISHRPETVSFCSNVIALDTSPANRDSLQTT